MTSSPSPPCYTHNTWSYPLSTRALCNFWMTFLSINTLFTTEYMFFWRSGKMQQLQMEMVKKSSVVTNKEMLPSRSLPSLVPKATVWQVGKLWSSLLPAWLTSMLRKLCSHEKTLVKLTYEFIIYPFVSLLMYLSISPYLCTFNISPYGYFFKRLLMAEAYQVFSFNILSTAR